MRLKRIIAAMLILVLSAAAFAYAEGEEQEQVSSENMLLDDCVDFSRVYDRSEEVYTSVIDEGDRTAYGTDYTMFMRSSLTPAWVVYEIEPDLYPIFNTYFRQNEEISHFSFMCSEDGESWEAIQPAVQIGSAESWQWIPVRYSLKSLSSSAKYVKIIFSDKNAVEWSPMFASAELAYKQTTDIGFADCIGTLFEDAVAELKCLGLVSGYDRFRFKPYESVTRAEFAKMNSGILKLPEFGTAEQVFSDVPSDNWAAAPIAALYSLGIIGGDEMGRFNPENEITYIEAAKMLVYSLGYALPAEDGGGYPDGCRRLANRLGLFDGIEEFNENSPLSRGDAAIMIRNASETELMYQTGFGDNAEFVKSDTNILGEYHGIEIVRAMVSAASGMTVIEGSETDTNSAIIDDIVYDTTDFDMSDFLGMTVEAYVKTDENKLLYARTVSDKVWDISADKYIKFENGRIYYLDESYSERSIAADKNARIVYNGRYLTRAGVAESLDFDCGSMRIISNRDSAADVIIIWNYERHIAASGGRLSGAISDRLGGTFRINADNADCIGVNQYGENTDFYNAEFCKGDVISVAESRDGGVVRAEISAAAVSGTVTYYSDNDLKMTIDGTEYEVTENLRELGGTIKGGSEVAAYMDINNRIFAVETLGGFEYMYLANSAAPNEFGSSVLLYLIDTAGNLRTLNATERTRVDGSAGSVADIAALTPQLVRVRVNSAGEVSSVETAKPTGGAVGAEEFSLSFSSDSCKYYGGSMSVFASKYQLGSATPVFFVPKDVKDIQKYDAADRSRLYSNFDYKVRLYDVSDEYTASAAVVYMDGSQERTVEPYDEVGVIRSVSQINNAEGEPCLMLSVYIRGQEREIYFANDGGEDMTGSWLPNYKPRGTADGSNPFRTGEVIQYYSDSESHCRSFRMLLTDEQVRGGRLYEKNTGDYGALSDENYFSELYSAYAVVRGRFADKLMVSTNDDGTRLRTIPLGGAAIYVFDTVRDSLRLGDAADIEYGDFVFVRMNFAETIDIVVVK